jgi:Arm DNA-binding domain
VPRIRLTKSAIDDLPTPSSDVIYWDAALPGFGVKVTPKGRKVFVVLYRTGGAGSKLRKFTIGPHGRVTLHQARVAAQKVFAARLEGRDLAAEKLEARRRLVTDRVEDLLEMFIEQRLAQNRSAGEIASLLRREIGRPWAGKSIRAVTKRDVVEVVETIVQRGAPVAANKTLKSIKTFLRWCADAKREYSCREARRACRWSCFKDNHFCSASRACAEHRQEDSAGTASNWSDASD